MTMNVIEGTLSGSGLRVGIVCSRFNEFMARSAAKRDRRPAPKASRMKSAISLAVPSPVLSATLPVKPSVTITSTRSEGMSDPSTKPTKS